MTESNENNNTYGETFTITDPPSGTLNVRNTDIDNPPDGKDNTQTTIEWDWDSISGADSYEIWLSNDGSSYNRLGDQTNTTWRQDVDAGGNPLVANTRYWLKVKAYNSCGFVEDAASAYTSIQNGTGATFSNVAYDSMDVAPQGTFTNLSTGNSGVRVRLVTSSTSCSTAATPDPPYRQDTNAVTFSGLSPETDYYACVRTRNADGDENNWTGPYGPQRTPAQTPSTPSWADPNHNSQSETSLQWDWNSVSETTTSYELRYSDGSSTGQCDSVTSGTQCNDTGLADNTRYTVQVRACHSNASPQCSNWSSNASAYTSIEAARSIEVVDQTANSSDADKVDVNIAAYPNDDQSGAFAAPSPDPGNANSNYICLRLNSETCGSGSASWGTSASRTFTALDCGTTYNMTVETRNGDGDTRTYGDSFTTQSCNQRPNTPTNQSPADGARVGTTQPTLSASDFSDPDGDSHLSSQWQVCDNSSCSNVRWNSGETTSNLTSVTVPSSANLSNGNTYWWRVRYSDDAGGDSTRWSSYSNTTSFTVDTSGPSISFSPTSRSWNYTDASVDVSVTDGAGVDYSRYCWTTGSSCDPGTSNSNDPPFSCNGASPCNATLTQSNNGNWNLCVRARDSLGNWSSTRCSGRYQVDQEAPTIGGFTVNGVSYGSSTTDTDGTVDLAWSSVSDSGGSGLKQVEMWRAPDANGSPDSNNWSRIRTITSNLTDGSTTDSPGDGVWWYGIHVVDNAGNCIKGDTSGSDNGHCGGVSSDPLDTRTQRDPIQVTVDTGPPSLSASPSSSSGWQSSGTTVTLNVSDSGSGVSQARYRWDNSDAKGGGTDCQQKCCRLLNTEKGARLSKNVVRSGAENFHGLLCNAWGEKEKHCMPSCAQGD